MSTDRFGPQGVEVAAVVRRASVITADEADQLSWLWDAWDAARAAAADPAGNTGWAAASWAQWDAAWTATMNAAWYAPRAAAARAAATTAAALSVRHLIDHYGFTQDQYDTLTGPWRQTIGPVHPDDEETVQ